MGLLLVFVILADTVSNKIATIFSVSRYWSVDMVMMMWHSDYHQLLVVTELKNGLLKDGMIMSLSNLRNRKNNY